MLIWLLCSVIVFCSFSIVFSASCRELRSTFTYRGSSVSTSLCTTSVSIVTAAELSFAAIASAGSISGRAEMTFSMYSIASPLSLVTVITTLPVPSSDRVVPVTEFTVAEGFVVCGSRSSSVVPAGTSTVYSQMS